MSLRKGLVAAAALFADKMRDRLSQPGYPTGADRSYRPARGYKPIQDTIRIGSVEGGEAAMSITVTVGGKDAPYTRAYEYGSGIHAEEGGEEYPIEASKSPYLFFPVGAPPAGRWPKYVGDLLPGQLFRIQEVLHPGIEAKPFARPALNDAAPLMKAAIGQAFSVEIRTTVLKGITKVE